MKICYVGDGSSIHIERWLDYFAGQGHDISLLTDISSRSGKYRQIHIGHKSGLKIIHYYCSLSDIKKFISSYRPDILHGHFISGYGYWSALSGFHPLVLTAWGSDIYRIPRDKIIARFLTRYALHHADLVTADSVDLKNAIIELASKTKRVELIHFGVDTTLFQPAPDKEKIRVELNLTGRYIILSNRRLDKYYNIEIIIRSFARLKKQYAGKLSKDIVLIILGEGGERKKLEQLVGELNLTGLVIFTGEIEHNQLLKYLQSADLFISIPLSDATSVSLLEAMSVGLPVMVSDIASNREWIENEKNGILVSPKNIDEIAKILFELLSDKEKLDNMGKLNRSLAIQRAEFKQQMMKMESFYAELLSRVGHGENY